MSMYDRRARGAWVRFKRWWRMLTCRHHRTFHFLPDATWSRDGRTVGPQRTIKVEGCCDCMRVVGCDYGE